MANEIEGAVIGIDLGTTCCCAAVWRDDHVEIIPNRLGNFSTPCYVAFTDEEFLIGHSAKNQAAKNPNNTIFDTKRLIGRKFRDSSVQDEMKFWPFKVIMGSDDKPLVEVTFNGKVFQFSAEQITSLILERICEDAQIYHSKPVKKAVVAVPSYFDDSQRQETMIAGKFEGLAIDIIDEPVAAAFAYHGRGKFAAINDGTKNILVFDLGGASLDVSLLTFENGRFKLQSTARDAHLGGEDFDQRMMNHCIKESKGLLKEDIRKDPKALAKLKKACEEAKQILSYTEYTTVEIEWKGIDLTFEFTRPKFEQLNLDLFRRCMYPVYKCLRDAKLEKNSVQHVIIVGGSTKIPKVQQLLMDFFNGKELCKDINPEQVIASGAAVYAAVLG